MWSNVFLSLFIALAGLALLRCACARVHLGRQELVRRDDCHAWLAVELRRSVALCSHADGLGGQSFPQPVETRTLTLLGCGLPLWTRCESIGLPSGSEARFDELVAADFDRHFTLPFTATAPRRTAIRAIRLLMPA